MSVSKDSELELGSESIPTEELEKKIPQLAEFAQQLFMWKLEFMDSRYGWHATILPAINEALSGDPTCWQKVMAVFNKLPDIKQKIIFLANIPDTMEMLLSDRSLFIETMEFLKRLEPDKINGFIFRDLPQLISDTRGNKDKIIKVLRGEPLEFAGFIGAEIGQPMKAEKQMDAKVIQRWLALAYSQSRSAFIPPTKTKIEEVLKQLEQENKLGELILEVGPNPHPALSIYNNSGKTIIGIDVCLEEEAIRPWGVKARTIFIKGDIHDLDRVLRKPEVASFMAKVHGPARAAFDSALFLDVLNFIDYRSVLPIVIRYLKVGGRLIISNMTGAGLNDLFHKKGVKSNAEFFAFLEGLELEIEHYEPAPADEDVATSENTESREIIVARTIQSPASSPIQTTGPIDIESRFDQLTTAIAIFGHEGPFTINGTIAGYYGLKDSMQNRIESGEITPEKNVLDAIEILVAELSDLGKRLYSIYDAAQYLEVNSQQIQALQEKLLTWLLDAEERLQRSADFLRTPFLSMRKSKLLYLRNRYTAMLRTVKAIKVFISDDRREDVDIDVGTFLKRRYWWTKQVPIFVLGPHIFIESGLPLIHISKYMFHTALERVISNAIAYASDKKRIAAGWVSQIHEEITILAHRKDDAKGKQGVEIIISSLGHIKDRLLEVDPNSGLQNVFVLNRARQNFSRGIGLPFTAMLIRQMGGSIFVQNAYEAFGKNRVEVSIWLPAVKYSSPLADENATRAPASSPLARHHKQTKGLSSPVRKDIKDLLYEHLNPGYLYSLLQSVNKNSSNEDKYYVSQALTKAIEVILHQRHTPEEVGLFLQLVPKGDIDSDRKQRNELNRIIDDRVKDGDRTTLIISENAYAIVFFALRALEIFRIAHQLPEVCIEPLHDIIDYHERLLKAVESDKSGFGLMKWTNYGNIAKYLLNSAKSKEDKIEFIKNILRENQGNVIWYWRKLRQLQSIGYPLEDIREDIYQEVLDLLAGVYIFIKRQLENPLFLFYISEGESIEDYIMPYPDHREIVDSFSWMQEAIGEKKVALQKRQKVREQAESRDPIEPVIERFIQTVGSLANTQESLSAIRRWRDKLDSNIRSDARVQQAVKDKEDSIYEAVFQAELAQIERRIFHASLSELVTIEREIARKYQGDQIVLDRLRQLIEDRRQAIKREIKEQDVRALMEELRFFKAMSAKAKESAARDLPKARGQEIPGPDYGISVKTPVATFSIKGLRHGIIRKQSNRVDKAVLLESPKRTIILWAPCFVEGNIFLSIGRKEKADTKFTWIEVSFKAGQRIESSEGKKDTPIVIDLRKFSFGAELRFLKDFIAPSGIDSSKVPLSICPDSSSSPLDCARGKSFTWPYQPTNKPASKQTKGSFSSFVRPHEQTNEPTKRVSSQVEDNERRTEFDLAIYRIRIPPRQDLSKFPRGLELFQHYLGHIDEVDLTDFDLLYDNSGILVAVFPVLTEEAKSIISAKGYDIETVIKKWDFFNFSHFNINMPRVDDSDAVERWIGFVQERSRHQRVIEAYAKAKFRGVMKVERYYASIFSSFPYAYARVRMADSKNIHWAVRGFSPDIEFSGERSDINREYAKEYLSNRNQVGLHHTFIPVFPRVYNPGDSIVFESDRQYFESIITEFDIKPWHDVLILGPGSGIDVWVVSLRTNKTIFAIGINPFEVVNLQAFAESAGFNADVVLGDNLISDDGELTIPGRKFDFVLWNMQQLDMQNSKLSIKHGRTLWDGDVQGVSLKRFAKGLPRVLKPNGQALIWQPVHWLKPGGPDNIDFVGETLRSAGEYDILISMQPNRLTVERKGQDVYLIRNDFGFGSYFMSPWGKGIIGPK